MFAFKHCPNCGAKYTADPVGVMQTCSSCKMSEWHNPRPVVLGLIPTTTDGLIIVQRGIEPAHGEWALPGGYLDFGETWQEGVVREVFEETDIPFPISSVHHYWTESIPSGKQILIFATLPKVPDSLIEDFIQNDEVLALDIMHEPRELAFLLHTVAVRRYLRQLHQSPPS